MAARVSFSAQQQIENNIIVSFTLILFQIQSSIEISSHLCVIILVLEYKCEKLQNKHNVEIPVIVLD